MTPAPLSYDDVRTRRLNDAVIKQVYGIPLEISEERTLIAGRRFLPVTVCLCVQDSPENPCPCRDFVVWLPVDKIILSGKTERRSDDGQPLHSFSVASDAEVLIEDRVRTCKIIDLDRVLDPKAALPEQSLQESDSLARVNKNIVRIAAKIAVLLIDAITNPDFDPPGRDVIVGKPPIG